MKKGQRMEGNVGVKKGVKKKQKEIQARNGNEVRMDKMKKEIKVEVV